MNEPVLSDCVSEIKLKIFEDQHKIINLQSDAINELVSLIAQHEEISEEDVATAKAKIDEAAKLRTRLNL